MSVGAKTRAFRPSLAKRKRGLQKTIDATENVLEISHLLDQRQQGSSVLSLRKGHM